MTEWLKWTLGILFAIGVMAELANVVDGFKPDSWSNKHYRGVKAREVLTNMVLLYLVIIYA